MRNPNGYGGVSRLPGIRRRPYRARITAGWRNNGNGRRVQCYDTIGYFESREDALMALASFHGAPYDTSLRSITFLEVYNRWSPQHFAAYPSVKRVTESAMSHCRPLWNRPMAQLRAADLQRVIASMSGLSRAYQKKVRSLMHMQFSWCMKNDVLQKDYSAFVDIPGKDAQSPRQVFTAAEIRRLWELFRENAPLPGEPEKYCGRGFLASVLLLLYTGMRVGELLSLQKEHVHLTERYIDLRGTKTRAARRLVPLHRDILPVMAELMGASPGTGVMDGPDGERLTYSRYKYSWFDKVMAGLGMAHTPHDTRHTFVSGLDTAGVPRSTLKFIIGHSLTRDVTDRYTHKNIAELTGAVDMLEY